MTDISVDSYQLLLTQVGICFSLVFSHVKLPKLFNGKDEMYVGSLSKYPGVSHNVVVYGTVVLVFFCLELRVSNSDEEFSFFIMRSCQMMNLRRYQNIKSRKAKSGVKNL